MTSDDDRIRYLGAETPGDDLDDVDRSALGDLRALLSDPSLWDEPSAGLEDAVVAAVVDVASPVAPALAPARLSRGRRLALVSGAAAAAAILVALVAVLALRDTGGTEAQFAAALVSTPLAPRAHGSATFTQTESGWRIELDAAGLARLDHGRFYQAWLRSDDGTLVAAGTFNEGHHVVLWAGVSPVDHPTITVTEEAADNDAASSGRRGLTGSVRKR
jgi:hypothetical protein